MSPKDPRIYQTHGTCESKWVYMVLGRVYPTAKSREPILFHKIITWFGFGCIACETATTRKKKS